MKWQWMGGLALAALALAGCGRWDDSRGPGVSVSGAQWVPVAQADDSVRTTEVIRYEPAAPSSADPAQDGACWSASIAAPRPGAYRCAAGNAIMDPCFATADGALVACEPDPIKGEPGTLLRLTAPLPAAETFAAGGPRAWLVELADGAICAPFTGARGSADGQVFSYGCAQGGSGESSVLLDELQAGEPWLARQAFLGGGEAAALERSGLARIRRVWQ